MTTTAEDLARILDTALDGDAPENLDSYQAAAEAVLDKGWKSPEDTNALTNKAIAYDGLILRLAIALDLAAEGDTGVDTDLSELADRAVAAARESQGVTP